MFLLVLFALWLSSATAAYLSPNTKHISINEAYDYVVVGGGIGGLVTATRLSEDPSVSVLLVEAGEFDDQAEDVTIPGKIGVSNSQRYIWNLTTVRQEFLDNENRTFGQGRVIGGSTIVNGLCWTRGSKGSFDAWKALGNPGWGWDDLLPYFAKSEKLTTKINDRLETSSLDDQDDLTHGHDGPVEIGFPRYFYNQSINFLRGVGELGIPFNDDPNSGNPTGSAVLPSSMTSEGQSRLDPRGAYLDPAISRPNLHVLVGHTVTRILHDNPTTETSSNPSSSSGVVITGVEFATNATAKKQTVSCRKEVILASGAIFSPVLLQLSGFGPRSVLENLDIPVAIDLPGVGRNLQDHPMIQPIYRYSAPDVFSAEDIVGSKRDEVRQEYLDHRTGPWTAPSVNVVAFPSLRSLTNDWAQLLQSAKETPPDHLPPSYDATLRAGYAAQERELRSRLGRADSPAYELMSTSWGRLAVGALRPFSRGTVEARGRPASIFASASIDPRYCSHAFDCAVLRLGLEFNARLIGTRAMAGLAPVPGPGLGPEDVRDRGALEATVQRLVKTESHPSGTTAMMPREKGGVVDTALKVYGTRNLRVVDAGVLPLVPDGHIQAAIYAVAEKAADIIKHELRTTRGQHLQH